MEDILTFLTQLQENNHKTWMDAHRAEYLHAKQIMDTVIKTVVQQMSLLDPELAGLTPRDCTFRINRDIRFAKNKNPYKNNMGAYLAKGGKKSNYAGYYLHIQPYGQSFIAGGLYTPNVAVLQKVRQEIDYNGERLAACLQTPDFIRFFGTLAEENSLKKPPKGYDNQNPFIKWIKLKSFIATHPMSDKMILSRHFIAHVLAGFKLLMPLNHFLNVAVEEAEQVTEHNNEKY